MIFRLLMVAQQLFISGILAIETENLHQRRVREKSGAAADGYDVVMAVQEEIDVFRIRELGSLSAPTKPVISPTVKPPVAIYAPAVSRRRMSDTGGTTATDYDIFDAIQEETDMFRNLGSLSVPSVSKPVAAPQKPVVVISPVTPPKPVYSPS